MKIAQVAPLYESVPPTYYGGTERVVSWLTEELVRQQHDVTLFASGDSITAAKLFPICERSLRLNPTSIDHLAHHILMIEQVFQMSDQFDVIHAHIDYLLFPLIRRHPTIPVITTLHGRLDMPDLQPLYHEFSDIPVVSISNYQRLPLPTANWVDTVYHGIPTDLHRSYEQPGNYLAFLGRISPEKRLDIAIEIATKAGMPLKVAAKIDKVDREYYETSIKPLIEGNPLVELIGEIGDEEKTDFLGNAYALLFPIDWPEPFGLVMIEAMACGTPVIARRCGSVPEVIDHGVTGFTMDTVDEAVEAVAAVASLDRRRVRQVYEERFSAERMANDYLEIYERMMMFEASFALNAKRKVPQRVSAKRLLK